MSYFTAGKHRHKRSSKQSAAGRALLTDPLRRSMVARDLFSAKTVAEAADDGAPADGRVGDEALVLV